MALQDANARFVLAADFGGTQIKFGVVRQQIVVSRRSMPAQSDLPLKDRLNAVADEWEQLLDAQGRSLSDCDGVALALPFLKHACGHRVHGKFGKFPGADEVDLPGWAQDRFGLPIEFENDLRMALLGEWSAGAAGGRSDVVMIALGTGIGCAVISEGRLMKGYTNRAATLFGHATINSNAIRGRCGNIGCAEDLASTGTLDPLARAHPKFESSKLRETPQIDYLSIFDLAADGDDCAKALLSESLKIWSIVVQNAILAYDPEMVVIGGGVTRSNNVLLPAIQEHLGEFMPDSTVLPEVVIAALGDDSALVGAAAVLQKKYHL